MEESLKTDESQDKVFFFQGVRCMVLLTMQETDFSGYRHYYCGHKKP